MKTKQPSEKVMFEELRKYWAAEQFGQDFDNKRHVEQAKKEWSSTFLGLGKKPWSVSLGQTFGCRFHNRSAWWNPRDDLTEGQGGLQLGFGQGINNRRRFRNPRANMEQENWSWRNFKQALIAGLAVEGDIASSQSFCNCKTPTRVRVLLDCSFCGLGLYRVGSNEFELD